MNNSSDLRILTCQFETVQENLLLNALILFLVVIVLVQNLIVFWTMKIKSSSAAIIYNSLALSDCFMAIQFLVSVLQFFPPDKLNIFLLISVFSTFMLAGDKAFSLAFPFLYSFPFP